MQPGKFYAKNPSIKGILYLCIILLFFIGCQEEQFTHYKHESKSSFPPRAIDPGKKFETLSAENTLQAIEAEKIKKMEDFGSMARIDGSTAYIHFNDENSCLWNPGICANTFVVWPGYIQNTGNRAWGYAWMSNGPGTNFISNGTGSHYHIAGLSSPDIEPNPKHTAMLGTDWFAFYMQKSGNGRINFDLTEIKVKGTVPITLYFKTAGGSWMYWPSIGPGWWYLPGATSIQEFHIRATSGTSSDKYSIDDIQVRGL